ncbi:MAG TPA: acyl-ACP--UDP-N-acetylglucosamine O-acyltransferase [Aminobacterium sp.]|jgi:UDP-N-acetylglucosamine acyltransferase|uniref:acyl-ACP--UDP-N-acetylglucosamine O-acyltransferase n=1 Tax=Aminobacterium TaxID=81466 RepID=UPI0004659229|nr:MULTISPECIES: acyl-ACP--UDP-N-acetylglucosamine O-acyltransferase [Aminobacterium]HCA40406.1 acyl-ACP--UDP-N-acetylglucosamine O-acyltransferase [Aminobacterium sp.]
MSVTIHSTALVSPQAEVEDGVVIGPYCIVGDRVHIGRETVLEAYVRILDYVELGAECHVFENAILGREPQDHGFKGEESWVRIGNSVTLRENVTIHRASGEGAVTSVGDGCFIMEGVHLGHNVHIGKGVTIANKAGLAGYVSIDDGTVIGGIAGIHQFVRVGRYCMIGGLSKIVKDVPPFLLVDGHPASVHGINQVGLKRAGFSSHDRMEIKRLYHNLYHSGLPFRSAAENIETENNPNAAEVVAFIRQAKRGISPWPREIRREDDDH